MPTIELTREFTFEAAHQLPYVPPGHKCGRMHGHSYRLHVTVAGPVDPETGWLMDYADIKAAVAPMLTQLDHHNLNDYVENPTCENMLVWLWGKLPLPLTELRLSETGSSWATYRGETT